MKVKETIYKNKRDAVQHALSVKWCVRGSVQYGFGVEPETKIKYVNMESNRGGKTTIEELELFQKLDTPDLASHIVKLHNDELIRSHGANSVKNATKIPYTSC